MLSAENTFEKQNNNIDWNEPVIINPSEDYYMTRWYAMSLHITQAAIRSAIISVVIAIIACIIAKEGFFSSIGIFFTVLFAVFIMAFSGLLFYTLTFKDEKKTSFVVSVFRMFISYIKTFIIAGLNGGIIGPIGILKLIFGIFVLAITAPIAIILFFYMILLAVVSLVYYAVMYLIDKKVKIRERTGIILDNTVSIVCVLISIALFLSMLIK